LIVTSAETRLREEGSKQVTEVTGLKGRRVSEPTALWRFFGGRVRIEKISAVTLKVASMRNSVRFYGDVLGMEVIYGGEDGSFSSLRANDGSAPILNLEQRRSVTSWGRMIFYVADVDA
jgi:catechol-2,3-dioxygenase